jgi:sterol desaturase/sphingolipid hydroxylase (fatty acid hydroxylase superfamily)
MAILLYLATFIALGAGFTAIECTTRRRAQPIVRAGYVTDLVHVLASNSLPAAVVQAGAIAALAALSPTTSWNLMSARPLWLQLVVIIALTEIAFYAIHRAMHAVPALWRLHRIHHTPVEMDWLSGYRKHALETGLHSIATLAPMALLGFSPDAWLVFGVIGMVFTGFTHLDTTAQLRWLEQFVVTPRYHAWHHAAAGDAQRTNLAGKLSVLDRLFGTRRPPELDATRGWPDATGLDEPAPTTWWHRPHPRVAYYAALPAIYLRQIVSNVRGIATVVDMLWLRPVPGGLLAPEHPCCTGRQLGSERTVWADNLVFAAPRASARATAETDAEPDNTDAEPDTDAEIVTRVGRYMAAMVRRSAATPTHPHGATSRMPPAINYLHGPVHYNGGWFVFDSFADAIAHVSDPAFRRELHRFVRVERREPLFVFRDRDYDREEFAQFVCFLRSVLPWFSNSNGPKRKVLWGNPAPYAVVNLITGNWIRETRRLIDARTRDQVARPPISAGRYFRASYHGWRRHTLWPERTLARITARRIAMRGAKGNLFFVDERALREQARARHQAASPTGGMVMP